MIHRLALVVSLLSLGVSGLALFAASRDTGNDEEATTTEHSASPTAQPHAWDTGNDEEATTTEHSASPTAQPHAWDTGNDEEATTTDREVDDHDTTALFKNSTPKTDAALPGQPLEFGPVSGMVLAVVGVAYDDVLNLRGTPNGAIIATLKHPMGGEIDDRLVVRTVGSGGMTAELDPRSEGIIATGRTRRLATTVWHEVTVGGLQGWASGAYLAPLGATYDMTSRILETADETPTAPTLVKLGTMITDMMVQGSAKDQDAEQRLRTAVASVPGVSEGLGDITIDVLGLSDESRRGYRLTVFALPGGDDWMQGEAGPFTFRSLEVTLICDGHRGVTEEGFCH